MGLAAVEGGVVFNLTARRPSGSIWQEGRSGVGREVVGEAHVRGVDPSTRMPGPCAREVHI